MTALSDLLNEARGDRNVDQLISSAEQRGHAIDRGTIYRALAGDHSKRPREKTLTAFAEVFGVDVRKVREAADRPAGEREPWVPTPEAAQLSKEQRDALNRLIKTIVQGGQAHGNATPTKPAAPTPLGPRQPKPSMAQEAATSAVQRSAAKKSTPGSDVGRAMRKKQDEDAELEEG